MQEKHSCGGNIGTRTYPKESKKQVFHLVMQNLKECPLYRAIDIKKDILQKHGVRLPYKCAWIGKEVARAAIHGHHSE